MISVDSEGQALIPQTDGRKVEAIVTARLVVAVEVGDRAKTLESSDSVFYPHRGHQAVPPPICCAQGMVFAAFAREAQWRVLAPSNLNGAVGETRALTAIM